MLVLLGGAPSLRAQDAEVDAVTRIIREETESYYRRDADAWTSTWVNDSTAIRTFITGGSYSVALGWQKFGPGTVASLRRDPTPQPARIDWSNVVVRIDGALAWAEYDERTTRPDVAPLLARQQRTLIKRNGAWRILSGGSFVESSFGTSPGAIESRLDAVGRDLTGAAKHRDAIRVLALNAQMHPRSAVAHRGLGEAYAAAGETKLAIRSYETALAMDPGNAASTSALARLRAKK
jgi:tetratricopeptide (TPR) repeat protein